MLTIMPQQKSTTHDHFNYTANSTYRDTNTAKSPHKTQERQQMHGGTMKSYLSKQIQ